MNIAIVSYHGCPVARLGEKDTGGMNVYVLNMAKELSKLGNNVDVFTRRHDITDPQIVPLSENSRVVHIPAGLISEKKHNLHEYIDDFVEGVLDYSKSNSYIYDYIHSHYWLSGLVAGKLSDIWNIPHTVTFHTLAKTKVRAIAGVSGELEVLLPIEGLVDVDALCERLKKDVVVANNVITTDKDVANSGAVFSGLIVNVDKTEPNKTLGNVNILWNLP